MNEKGISRNIVIYDSIHSNINDKLFYYFECSVLG